MPDTIPWVPLHPPHPRSSPPPQDLIGSLGYTIVPLDKVDLTLVSVLYTQGDFAAVTPIFSYTMAGDGVPIPSAFSAWRQLLGWLTAPGLFMALLCLLTVDEPRHEGAGFLGEPRLSSRFMAGLNSVRGALGGAAGGNGGNGGGGGSSSSSSSVPVSSSSLAAIKSILDSAEESSSTTAASATTASSSSSDTVGTGSSSSPLASSSSSLVSTAVSSSTPDTATSGTASPSSPAAATATASIGDGLASADLALAAASLEAAAAAAAAALELAPPHHEPHTLAEADLEGVAPEAAHDSLGGSLSKLRSLVSSPSFQALTAAAAFNDVGSWALVSWQATFYQRVYELQPDTYAPLLAVVIPVGGLIGGVGAGGHAAS